MVYSILFSRNAVKELEKISEPFYTGVKNAIAALSINPRPAGFKKLKGRNSYRIRIGSYRVIYDIIDNELIVDIITLGHRKDVYD